MKKTWSQVWKNLLFQHFELKDPSFLQTRLPEGVHLDSFDDKVWLGLVSMQMHDVKHALSGNWIWFKRYNELNVRTYVRYKGKPGVLFLSLDVDSLLSVFGAKLFYKLPYRYRRFEKEGANIRCYKGSSLVFDTSYSVGAKPMKPPKESFAYWVSERYFFIQNDKIGNISHKPWSFYTAAASNHNLDILAGYEVGPRADEVLFYPEIAVQTYKLQSL